MKKLFKSRKALSPVVAAIILIAVTVAVSIAVAAWMGALTFTFMKTEELKITGITWTATNATLTVSNTGSSTVSVTGAKVDDASATCEDEDGDTITTDDPLDIPKGDSATIVVFGSFASGTKYTIALVTASGNQYPYSGTRS